MAKLLKVLDRETKKILTERKFEDIESAISDTIKICEARRVFDAILMSPEGLIERYVWRDEYGRWRVDRWQSFGNKAEIVSYHPATMKLAILSTDGIFWIGAYSFSENIDVLNYYWIAGDWIDYNDTVAVLNTIPVPVKDNEF